MKLMMVMMNHWKRVVQCGTHEKHVSSVNAVRTPRGTIVEGHLCRISKQCRPSAEAPCQKLTSALLITKVRFMHVDCVLGTLEPYNSMYKLLLIFRV
jgi:hypothetical protein